MGEIKPTYVIWIEGSLLFILIGQYTFTMTTNKNSKQLDLLQQNKERKTLLPVREHTFTSILTKKKQNMNYIVL